MDNVKNLHRVSPLTRPHFSDALLIPFPTILRCMFSLKGSVYNKSHPFCLGGIQYKVQKSFGIFFSEKEFDLYRLGLLFPVIVLNEITNIIPFHPAGSLVTCFALNGESSIMNLGFGIVAMVAMTPLITIQLLGFRAVLKNHVRQRIAMRRILEADDEQIIRFM